MIRRIVTLITAGLVLAACQTSSPPPQPQTPAAPIEPVLEPRWQVPPRPLAYDMLPGWDAAGLAPGLNALRRSCASFAAKGPAAFISTRQVWAGRVSDWLPACEALSVIGDASSAKAVIQALFVPVEVQSNTGETRFTGYFEPEYEARLYPQGPFTEPVLAKPSDLVVQGGKVYQRQRSGRLKPYPKRAEITRRPTGQVLAYMRPGDLFFLQIQGSGRLTLADGRTIRAVYAANNGHTFKSTANWLMRKRWISRGQASMTGIKAWMATAPDRRVREAMNANPRYIFFATLPEGDPTLGPNGSLGVPLTPLGSVAVDPAFHALGTPLFVQTSAPGLGGVWSGLLVAQDTGGAIKGSVRGDIYFGTGAEAGARADTVNTSGRMWILLPRAVAQRLRGENTVAALPSHLGDEASLP